MRSAAVVLVGVPVREGNVVHHDAEARRRHQHQRFKRSPQSHGSTPSAAAALVFLLLPMDSRCSIVRRHSIPGLQKMET